MNVFSICLKPSLWVGHLFRPSGHMSPITTDPSMTKKCNLFHFLSYQDIKEENIELIRT